MRRAVKAGDYRLRPYRDTAGDPGGIYRYGCLFYDIENKLPLGNATQVRHMSELLNMSDVVSLHVPETESTKNMIGKHEFELMKPGQFY